MTISLNRRVLVVLGLYRPDPILLSRQLESLMAQTHRNVEVFVSADGLHDPDIRSVIAGFSGFPIHNVGFDTRAGVHANFARGLREAVAASRDEADLFAFCDQDDIWHPGKLERQLACFADTGTSLCHSDARIVSRAGDVLVSSLFAHEGRSRAATFADLLIMNSVTGMTAVFRRDVAIAAAPFPMSGCRYILHDHWIALVASLLGSVRFIDEPLVDYTQHAGNVIGARQWTKGLPSSVSPSQQRAYLRKCYRQFAWRRRALDHLRRMLVQVPGARDRLEEKPVRALFDCDAGRYPGLAMSLAYRLRGEQRQADQIWRIWRGRGLCCASERRRIEQSISRPQAEIEP